LFVQVDHSTMKSASAGEISRRFDLKGNAVKRSSEDDKKLSDLTVARKGKFSIYYITKEKSN